MEKNARSIRGANKIIIFALIIFALFSWADFVFAFEVSYPTVFGHSVNETSSIGDYLCYFFGIILNLAFAISTIIIAWGGINYLIDYGRGKFTSEAKDWIKAGITGLLLTIMSSLIAVTISPAMTSCNFGILSAINSISSNGTSSSTGLPISIYQEIPIGTLTENLLTKTMDSCFGFDPQGNPIDEKPTYLNHDRADCLSMLYDGAENKLKMISALSGRISSMMSQCSCADKCDASCGGEGGCNQPSEDECKNNPSYACSGSCVGGGCSAKAGSADCCPEGIKDKIEHGPVEITLENPTGTEECRNKTVTFMGLDEFRCPNPISGEHYSCDDIKSFVQNGNSINKSNWNKLNLLQQLMYFEIKMDEIKKSMQGDEILLKNAVNLLQSKQCYLSNSYVDLVKTYQQTDNQQKIILKKPFLGLNNQPVDISKYCAGFNYGNSACLKKCNDACSDSSPQAIQLYGACFCQPNDTACFAKQEQCIEKAYNDRPCANGPDPSQNFGNCISSCQNDCKTGCEVQDPSKCSSQYNACIKQCDKDSQCVLENESHYLFGAENFAHCGQSVSDGGNAGYCINNAYICKNGSDNYSTENCTPAEDCSQYGFCSGLMSKAECESSNCLWHQTGSGGLCGINPNCKKAVCNPEKFQNGTTISSKCPDFPGGCHSGTQCNQYSYNDDPLTFYCQNDWISDPGREDHNVSSPIGKTRKCDLKEAVPVGQTVDNALAWAEGIISGNDGIKEVINLMKLIGKAKDDSIIKDYCKCNALNENRVPTCLTGCQYDKSACTCTFVQCQGSSCGQIMTYLQKLGILGRGIHMPSAEKYAGDVLTELSFSRKQTNWCSVVANNYPDQKRLLSCTRVQHEQIPPINGGKVIYNDQTFSNSCYGVELGKAVNASLTDDWYCCEQETKN